MNTISQWLKMQTKTRWRYVLFFGVLFWGCGTALAMTVWAAILGHLDAFSLVLTWILFPAGGVFWGLAMWWWMSRHRARVHPKS